MKVTGINETIVRTLAKGIAPGCKVKLSPAKTGGLTGYISVAGWDEFGTKSTVNGKNYWEPCPHFWLRFLKAVHGYQSTGWVIWIQGLKFSYPGYNVLAKITNQLAKKNLVCKGICPDVKDSDPLSLTPKPTTETPILEYLTIPALDYAPVSPGEVTGKSAVNQIKNQVRPIYAATCSLYVLQELLANTMSLPDRVGSECPDHLLSRAYGVVNFKRELSTYAQAYSERFARNLFDFLTLASFGEARYGQGSKYKIGTVNIQESSRAHAYEVAMRYDPRSMLPILSHCFHGFNWGYSPSVGGTLWGKIADAAVWYFKAPPVVFADHCVDLAHNGGLAFNKGYILSNPSDIDSFMAMLDKKRNGSLLDGKGYIRLEVNADVYALLVQASRLGFATMPKRDYLVIKNDPQVPTINWGSETLTIQKGKGKPSEYNADSDDSDSDDNEPVEFESYPRRR